jgi:hypothetical protein
MVLLPAFEVLPAFAFFSDVGFEVLAVVGLEVSTDVISFEVLVDRVIAAESSAFDITFSPSTSSFNITMDTDDDSNASHSAKSAADGMDIEASWAMTPEDKSRARRAVIFMLLGSFAKKQIGSRLVKESVSSDEGSERGYL